METRNKRGRPRNPFEELYEPRVWERLCTGVAEETVEAEAKELFRWANENKVFGPNGYLKPEQLRRKINKRYGGATGYQQVRNWKLQELERASNG